MSESITIARPYAKAVFDIAKSRNMLNEWDKFLSYLSIMTNDDNVVNFIKNRTIGYNDKSRVIIDFLDSRNSFSKNIWSVCVNFVNVLAYYGRLLCVSDISILYKQYMNAELGRVEAVVKVAHAINGSQKELIVDCLSKRFNKKVSALFEIDEGLLGGFLVKTGDFVLDASIAGNLVSLRTKIMM